MSATIKAGYEVDTGREVRIPADRHIGITGQTQRSGKTTTIEALVSRAEGCALAFITKRGEGSFRMPQAQIPAFFRDPLSTQDREIAGWQFVLATLEARMRQPLYMHRKFIMKLCDAAGAGKKGPGWARPKSLRDVYANARIAQAGARAGFEESMYYELEQFLKLALPEIEQIQKKSEQEFSITRAVVNGVRSLVNRPEAPPADTRTIKIGQLHLAPGLNVMDIHEYSSDTQGLVISAALREIYRYGRNVKIILPEAQRFWPQTLKAITTPVAQFGELIVREGAAVGNLIYLDSQDMAGVAKVMLRAVTVWFFGVQGEQNEIERMLKMIPDLGRRPTATDIMMLKKGEFLVRYDDRLVKTYVQPAWLGDTHALAVATGDADVETVRNVEREKFSARVGEFEYTGKMNTDGAEADQDGAEIVDSFATNQKEATAMAKQLKSLKDQNDFLKGEVKRLDNELAQSAIQLILAKKAAVESSPDPAALPTDPGKAEHGVHLPAGNLPTQRQIPPGVPAEGVLVQRPENGGWQPLTDTQIDWLWAQFRQRALAEAPVILRLMSERPELQVNVEKKILQVNDATLRGQFALLIHDGFFEQERTGKEAYRELLRRGKRFSNNVQFYDELKSIAEMGFLTVRAGEGRSKYFRAAPGMRVEKAEA